MMSFSYKAQHPMASVRIGRVRIGDTPRVVATLVTPHLPNRLADARRDGADLVELRLDYLAHWPEARVVEAVKRAARATDLPLIATARAAREGAARRDGWIGDERRREALLKAVLPHVQAVDIELSSAIAPEIVAAARKASCAVIVSYHHFQSTPSVSRLRGLVGQCRARGADVVKLVTTARAPVDMVRLLCLLHERPAHPLVAFAMGPHALLSRLMASFFQSALLYAGLGTPDGATPAAPGQPSLRDLTAALKQFRLR